MVSWAVVSGDELEESGGEVDLIGAEHGAIHLDLRLVTLEVGERRDAESNPYEESFFVLEGEPVLQLAGMLHGFRPDDFGYVPVGMPHRWQNGGSGPAKLLRTRAPQPRAPDSAGRKRVLSDPGPRTTPSPIDATDPATRFVGHYTDESLPAPGPLQMKGFRSASARNVGLWMLVDEAIGAVHHTLFMVQFAPTGEGLTLGGQHYHPFEETYYIVEGEAVAHLEDESVPVRVGDVVFAGVNALHGFTNPTGDRVRWIEAQAPAPPPAEAFFFPSQWSR